MKVAIIGAGPIGVHMASKLEDYKIEYTLFDKGCLGQTIANWPEHTIFHSKPEKLSIAGVPLIGFCSNRPTKNDYLRYLRFIVKSKKLNLNSFEEVKQIDFSSKVYNVSTFCSNLQSTAEYNFTHVVLAVGSHHHHNIPPEISSFSGLKTTEFPLHNIINKTIAIYGGRHSALEYAINSLRFGAKKVILVQRGDNMDSSKLKSWVKDEIRWLKDLPNFEIKLNSKLSCIDGRLYLKDTLSKTRLDDVDFLISACGYHFDSPLLKKMGLNYEKSMNAINPNKNLYVIGTATAREQISVNELYIENSKGHVDQILQNLLNDGEAYRC